MRLENVKPLFSAMSRSDPHLRKFAQQARHSSTTRRSLTSPLTLTLPRVNCASWPPLLRHVGCRRVLRPSSFGTMALAEVGSLLGELGIR